MTNLLEIKTCIHDYIKENLSLAFEDKVYWIGERKNVPLYPYCLLSVIAENKDKRTAHYNSNFSDIDTRTGIITRYKTCTITVGIYNGWTQDTTESGIDMDEAKEFAYEQIDNLEGAFEIYPLNKLFSIQNISPIRHLHDVSAGGYMYRYEFDLTIGYNEDKIYEKEYGRSVDADFINNINFVVSIDENDNIIVETNKE